MTNNELEVAKLAALVSGNLKYVDSQTVTGSATSGPANKINPRNFIKQPGTQRPQGYAASPYTDNPSEILERVSVDTKALEIPIPDDIKKYAERYQEPTIQNSPIPVNFTPTGIAPNSINNTEILNLILTYVENIDNKLDLIIKKAKIKKNRKLTKRGQHGRQRNLAQPTEQPNI
jgi:hypothetical protein